MVTMYTLPNAKHMLLYFVEAEHKNMTEQIISCNQSRSINHIEAYDLISSDDIDGFQRSKYLNCSNRRAIKEPYFSPVVGNSEGN